MAHIKARVVREVRRSWFLGLVKLAYAVYAIEDDEQFTFYYRHLIELRALWTTYSWQFRDSTPRYELPVENES